MRKGLAIVLLVAMVGVSGSAEGIGLTLRGQAAATLGLENYLRGGAVGGQVIYKLFNFLPIGVEAYAEYDTWFNVFQVPVNLVIGKYLQLLVGVVLPVGDLNVEGDGGTLFNYVYKGFPNNFGIGVYFPFGGRDKRVSIDGFVQLTYTLASPVGTTSEIEAAFGSLVGVLMGIKAYAGVAIDLNL